MCQELLVSDKKLLELNGEACHDPMQISGTCYLCAAVWVLDGSCFSGVESHYDCVVEEVVQLHDCIQVTRAARA